MLTASQLHLEPVPGSVSNSSLQVPPALLSQLVQVPASATKSPSESVHTISVVNWKVVNRQVPPPSVQGARTSVPQGDVPWASRSPQSLLSAL
jgi:hypothetical protein